MVDDIFPVMGSSTRRRFVRASLALPLLAGIGVRARAADASLRALVDGPQRSPANRARDPFRHPVESLTFLGVGETSSVVEIMPGAAGYWTEILAPYLRDHGLYIAANAPADTTSAEMQKENAAFTAMTTADPGNYGKALVSQFKADRYPVAPAGSVDFVLTFRNVHNWMAAGETDLCFAAFNKALKPGGILGVEEHRGRSDQPQDPLAKSGYVREDVTIEFARKAGFRLVDRSEINANPRDTKDYPAGVWTLPPTFRMKDQDREKYAAIGESDRFLLKFEKVGA